MNCLECKVWISEYLDEELSDINSANVGKHLQACPTCQGMADELQSLKFEIEAALNSIPVPPNLEERILASILKEHRVARQQAWLTGFALMVLGIPILTLCSPLFLSPLRLGYKTISVFLHTLLTLTTLVVPPVLGLGITLAVVLLAAFSLYSLRTLLKGLQIKEVLS